MNRRPADGDDQTRELDEERGKNCRPNLAFIRAEAKQERVLDSLQINIESTNSNSKDNFPIVYSESVIKEAFLL